ncbi:hypothetical protein Micbo1qcDRAFT_190807 [Microdochium bolleyi]|uniref:Zn(2)-C6 fungal-type domain-containing protein n=1 Tax=Microdochium bolleyi TaxID=196109 RepID=A0A136ILT7_9PEZI|nr:hypothetical protein Micbo1qcDRAFT_190807 [Microdochium bolleyi]
MVFPGRLSTGCKLCRRRKVKCDEGKPGCNRCVVYGRPCPGYGDNFQFRPQEAKVKKAMSSAPAPLPSPPPIQSREHQSLCYFMSRFVARGMAGPFPGHLGFLYDLYDPDHLSSLELATLSAAEMTAYNKFGVPEMKQRAYRNRGAAIRALSTALSSPDRNVRFNDKTIGTVLLLATFADISGEGGARDGGHAPGLYYLLEQRGKDQLLTKTGSEIFFLGVMRLHIHSFVTNDYSYADPGGYSELMQDVDPLWRGRALVCKIPRLRSALDDHLTAMAKRYKLETSTGAEGQGTQQPQQQPQQGKSRDSSEEGDGLPPPPLQEDDIEQTMVLYMGCMKVLHELSEWDQSIATNPVFNSDIVEIETPTTHSHSPISPLSAQAPTFDTAHDQHKQQHQQFQPLPKRYDSRTACTVILLKSSRVMLLLSLLAYFKRLRDWVVAYPRLLGDPAENPLLAALFSDPSASLADIEKMLDDVRESVTEIERCVPFAVGREEDDLDGIASFQEGFGVGGFYGGGGGAGQCNPGKAGVRLATNQLETAAAALIIMHPLILVFMCPFSTPRQKAMSLDVLNRMDKNMGIRAARWRLKELSEAETKGLFFS